MAKTPTPLMIGWEAARANARPALIIQGIMLAVAIAFYTNPTTAVSTNATMISRICSSFILNLF